MPQFNIKIEGLNELRAAFKVAPEIAVPELKKAVQTSVNLIRPLMVKNAPYKKGKLRQNIFARTYGLVGKVGPDLQATPYALFVHQGTRPYTILPRTKPFLAFQINGRWIYTTRVRHPGIKANPFVEKTANEVGPYVKEIFSNTLMSIKKTMLVIR